MAKKPHLYPVLPPSPKKVRTKRGLPINVTTPTLYTKRVQADWYIKSTKTYTPFYLASNESINVGNSTKSGVRNPDWKVTIAKGGDATSNYTRSGYTIKPTVYTVFTESASSTSRGFGTNLGAALISVPNWSNVNDKALARIKNKLNGRVGNAQLGPPLAESREIHRLVRQINGLGMTAFKALLAAKASKGKSISKTAGDIWLGFGFGVNPLLSDLKSAADAIVYYTQRVDNRVVVTAAATEDYISGYPLPRTYSVAGDLIAYLTKIGFHGRSAHTLGVRYQAAYDLTVRSVASYSVADHLGLRVSALPSIFWELTPYSWVVDYFTTVGAWLDDAFYTVPGTCVYAMYNQRYHVKCIAYPKAFADSGFTTTLSGNPSEVEYFSFSRTKIAGLPTRELRVKSVDEIANHGITKLLNLGAIIAGRRGPRL